MILDYPYEIDLDLVSISYVLNSFLFGTGKGH